MDGPVTNILVIKLRYVGDVLLTTPLLRVLRESYPHATITALVKTGTESLLTHNPCLDQITVLPRRSWVQQLRFFNFIRSRSFDCVIDLSDGDRSAFLTLISGARMRIGFNNEERLRGIAYSSVVKAKYGTMHMLDYHAQTLIPLGLEPRVCAPEIVLTKEECQSAECLMANHGLQAQKWVMIHPAARYWFKAWPAERFATLGDALVRQGFQVVVVGSENERELADSVMQAAKEKFISLVGNTTIRELAALMKFCSLFVGNDAGPMHMAAAVGCPVVSLFGPTNPAVWGPYGKTSSSIYKGLDCRECFHPGCFRGESSCMKLITIDEVLLAAESLWRT